MHYQTGRRLFELNGKEMPFASKLFRKKEKSSMSVGNLKVPKMLDAVSHLPSQGSSKPTSAFHSSQHRLGLQPRFEAAPIIKGSLLTPAVPSNDSDKIFTGLQDRLHRFAEKKITTLNDDGDLMQPLSDTELGPDGKKDKA
jgi:hypothetical protein